MPRWRPPLGYLSGKGGAGMPLPGVDLHVALVWITILCFLWDWWKLAKNVSDSGRGGSSLLVVFSNLYSWASPLPTPALSPKPSVTESPLRSQLTFCPSRSDVFESEWMADPELVTAALWDLLQVRESQLRRLSKRSGPALGPWRCSSQAGFAD